MHALVFPLHFEVLLRTLTVISLGKLVCPLKPTSISSGKENAKEVFGQFRTVELRNSARFVQSAIFRQSAVNRLISFKSRRRRTRLFLLFSAPHWVRAGK